MFETVSLPNRPNRAARRNSKAGRLIAATVAAGTLLGASSAAAMPSGTEQDDQNAAVDEQAIRADHADWMAAQTQRIDEALHAAREAEAHRPRSAVPVVGLLTSLFGPRWGTLHGGIDIANAIGTPIVSVTDGVVIEAGPASGFGMWVRVQQDDGTIAVYGHVNEARVVAGQHVRAGELIATVGNRGQSTGPHLHFEVWAPGGAKLDPLGWLVSRGIQLAGPIAQ
ncbi:peptidoglycan DD-metalloendopeptidase family protein [Antrihabitans sp. YC3-6]|uniref:Peptidoglycan DD-metalloendopeptidase family protein n=1 Tax=Antrihabitans stalagmiti TaxID=2799499 RepID=A0A934NMF2_9NOCA|nr:peptidoglycan DD-metalloendopeptidase family protein [Antrihabitans stalagmiti]